MAVAPATTAIRIALERSAPAQPCMRTLNGMRWDCAMITAPQMPRQIESRVGMKLGPANPSVVVVGRPWAMTPITRAMAMKKSPLIVSARLSVMNNLQNGEGAGRRLAPCLDAMLLRLWLLEAEF